MNQLYYGDNLDILRQHVKDASMDLIYLDPPFNSKRDYNLIFKTPKGTASDVGRAMIADLKNTVEREGASLGLFVTLTPPTQPMIAEAASAGFYTSPHQGKFPKIQVLTIAGLLAGRERPSYPDLSLGAATFKKAAVEKGDGGQGELFS